MFSRRHPYLFFLLCVLSLIMTGMVIISLVIAAGIRRAGMAEWVDGGGQRVGIIEIEGVITDAGDILENIQRFRDDDTIKAIVMRIESPGGGVASSQEIYREIIKTVEKKTVVASLGSVAASGGYYVAAGADKIMANPGTITGSIGVIIGYTNFEALLDKIGLRPVVIKSGKYKDIGSPVREMSAEEKEILQQFIDQVHRQFIDAVIEGRGLERTVVEPLADGRIMTGETARRLELIDRLGNFEDAVALAGELAGIEGRITKVYPPEKRLSFMKYLAGESLNHLKDKMIHSDFSAGYLMK
ncbi:MAG: signal peptide peptidase SppA [Desulfobacterales bacterium]